MVEKSYLKCKNLCYFLQLLLNCCDRVCAGALYTKQFIFRDSRIQNLVIRKQLSKESQNVENKYLDLFITVKL